MMYLRLTKNGTTKTIAYPCVLAFQFQQIERIEHKTWNIAAESQTVFFLSFQIKICEHSVEWEKGLLT